MPFINPVSLRLMKTNFRFSFSIRCGLSLLVLLIHCVANAQLATGHNVAGSAVLTDISSHNVFVFLDQDGDHKFESAVVLDQADGLKGSIHAEIAQHQLFM